MSFPQPDEDSAAEPSSEVIPSSPVVDSAVEDVRCELLTQILANIHSRMAHQGSHSRRTLPTINSRTVAGTMGIMQAVSRQDRPTNSC
jgi:hypothetical protein